MSLFIIEELSQPGTAVRRRPVYHYRRELCNTRYHNTAYGYLEGPSLHQTLHTELFYEKR